jgi:CBS domain-containing protein
VGEDETLMGVLSREELEEAAMQWPPDTRLNEVWPFHRIEARDLSAEGLPHVHPDQPLELALKRLGSNSLDVLPVLDRKEALHVIGEISLDDLLMFYRLRRDRV